MIRVRIPDASDGKPLPRDAPGPGEQQQRAPKSRVAQIQCSFVVDFSDSVLSLCSLIFALSFYLTFFVTFILLLWIRFCYLLKSTL